MNTTGLAGTRPIPRRVEDLVIYELHLGALGYGKPGPGTFADAIALLDYLVELGVSAVELLPMAEFGGEENWGYGSSHYFAIEYSGGGRDQAKFFIKECHRRGLAVISDVVYNHFTPDGERAEWMYDTDDNERNAYYWYEGTLPTTPPSTRPCEPPVTPTGWGKGATRTTCPRGSPHATTTRWCVR